MLTICDPRPARNCSGFTRRELLRVGGLALGGLTLPQLLAARAGAKEGSTYLPDNFVTGKSVVFLFLSGGPPHIEFFDPKMSAPSEIRSITGEVATKIPGVTFGGTFSKLAGMTDKIAIVRSYQSRNAGHEYNYVMTGGNNKLKATLSSMYARIVGTNHPGSGMPTNVLVKPEAVDAKLKLEGNFETGALPTLTQPGDLGPTYGAFDPSGGGELKKNMELKLKPEELQDRRSLLSSLDRIQRHVDSTGMMDGADRFQQQAFDVITRGVAEAFDLSKEEPKTIARYDTSGIFKQEELQRWYDMKRVSNLLGRQMLLARRLCEAGAGFVTVSDCGWDYHANGNSPKGMTGIWPMGNQVDHAVAAFVEDCHERGLSDKILLVVTGEMGRSPRINNDGGRDHYGELTSLLLSGGGLKMGQVIGQSDRTASRPATQPYTPEHLMATIAHVLFDIGELRIARGVPEPVREILTEHSPIDGLV
jgi:hypothetical protein